MADKPLTHAEIVELLPKVGLEHFNTGNAGWTDPTPKRGEGEHPDYLGMVMTYQALAGYDCHEQHVDLCVGDIAILDAKTFDDDRAAHQNKETRQNKSLGDFEVYVAEPGVVNINKLLPHEGLAELTDRQGGSLMVRWPMRKEGSDLRGAAILLGRLLRKAHQEQALGLQSGSTIAHGLSAAKTPKARKGDVALLLAEIGEHAYPASSIAKWASKPGKKFKAHEVVKLVAHLPEVEAVQDASGQTMLSTKTKEPAAV